MTTISREIMHTDIHTISEEDSLLEAYELMKEHSIRHLPVLNAEGNLVGLLSDRDVARAMHVNVISEFQQEISISSKLRVKDFMNWPVFSASEKSSVKSIAEAMLKQNISSVVILNERDRISGIVTSFDLISYLCQIIDRTDKKDKWPQWTLEYYLKQK